MSTPEEITELFHRYLDNSCTTAEVKKLLTYFEVKDNESLLKPLITAALENSHQESNDALQPVLNKAFQAIQEQIAPRKAGAFIRLFSTGSRRLRYAAVAALLIGIGISGWLLYKYNRGGALPAFVAEKAASPEPGGNKALLKLADGRVIVLDSMADGSLGVSGTAQIIKKEGQIVFSAGAEPANILLAATQINTVSTPRGGQYQVILPDGSKVWLNAATSLEFPTDFAGDERTVKVDGEAYFEIAGDASRPFYVTTRNMQVLVLGTHFNVNAYGNEPGTKTTLVEGRVKIISEAHSRLLQPGQQSVILNSEPGAAIVVQRVNTDEVIAWKNGLFVFNNADIMTIMRQVARWYDVTIKWEGAPPSDVFTGEVSRNSKITEVLKILELNNIHTKIEGKTITLML